MSESLKAKIRQISPENASTAIQIYHRMHGTNTSNAFLAVLAVGGLYSVAFGNLEEEETFRNIFLCLAYVNFIFNVQFWLHNRTEAIGVLSQMIDIARVLEQWSNARQSKRLMKLSNIAKSFADGYNAVAVVGVSLYTALPVMTKKHGVTISIIPDSEFWFWIVYIVEEAYLLSGCVAVYAMYTYQVQTTVCLYGLLENMSKHFLTAENNHRLNDLISRHQQVLDACSKFRVLTSRWAFIQTSAILIMVIMNTFSVIRGSRDPGAIMTIPLCMNFLFLFCAFGETLVSASEEIGWSAYRSDWLKANPDFRRKLVLVIERSQTPALLDAGLVGTLTLPTFTKILRIWFKYVQALVNLM